MLIKRNRQLLMATTFWLSLTVVTVASLMPVALLPPQAFSMWDKAQHALGFAWLALAGLGAFPRQSIPLVAGLLVWGAVIEVLQEATGWRHGDLLDWVADGAGVVCAWLLWRVVRRVLSQRA